MSETSCVAMVFWRDEILDAGNCQSDVHGCTNASSDCADWDMRSAAAPIHCDTLLSADLVFIARYYKDRTRLLFYSNHILCLSKVFCHIKSGLAWLPSIPGFSCYLVPQKNIILIDLCTLSSATYTTLASFISITKRTWRSINTMTITITAYTLEVARTWWS